MNNKQYDPNRVDFCEQRWIRKADTAKLRFNYMEVQRMNDSVLLSTRQTRRTR